MRTSAPVCLWRRIGDSGVGALTMGLWFPDSEGLWLMSLHLQVGKVHCQPGTCGCHSPESQRIYSHSYGGVLLVSISCLRLFFCLEHWNLAIWANGSLELLSDSVDSEQSVCSFCCGDQCQSQRGPCGCRCQCWLLWFPPSLCSVKWGFFTEWEYLIQMEAKAGQGWVLAYLGMLGNQSAGALCSFHFIYFCTLFHND